MHDVHNAATDILSDIVSRLQISMEALAALGAALDAHAHCVSLEPEIAGHVEAIVAALGAGDAVANARPEDVLPLLASIRFFTLTSGKLLFAATRGAAWTHTEAELLQAAGDVSVSVARRLKNVARDLDGLAERLQHPNAAFLDVGVGVAALSIEMARQWPNLRILGIDRWQPARENIHAARLSDRVMLRLQDGRELAERRAFDLAWIPGAFVARDAMPALIERIRQALRPGGWSLVALACPGGNLARRSALAPARGAVRRIRDQGLGHRRDDAAAGLWPGDAPRSPISVELRHRRRTGNDIRRGMT